MEQENMNVIGEWTEGEISNFVKVWFSVCVSLCYCYVSGRIVGKGALRLFLSVIPVVLLNTFLPLLLHTIHLGGSSAFFLVWLSNFKLLLFAFGRGPLSDPSLSLSRFVALASLPIKIPQQSQRNRSSKASDDGLKSIWNYAVKALLVAFFLRLYDYAEYIHPKLLLVIYSFHLYFGLELILAITGGFSGALVGIELEPQFNEPYLSTSLQDFWGRRWNMMVSRILRPTVYDPAVHVFAKLVGRRWAPLPAIFGTFMVSALMHELIFYYLGRTRPAWEITWFFLLHGVCLMAEIAVKKAVAGRWHLPRIVTAPLTVGFVMVTAFWLFFPPFIRMRPMERACAEYAATINFAKDVARCLIPDAFRR